MYITAWRAWRLAKRRNDWFLASVHRKAIWEGPLMTACCEPNLNSRHGLWSCATRDWLGDRYNPAVDGYTIFGEVRPLGKSVEWSEGWQSYKQMVLSLFWLIREVEIPRSLLGYKFSTTKAYPIAHKLLGAETLCQGEHIPGGDTNCQWPSGDEYIQVSREKVDRIARVLARRYDVDCSVEVLK